MTKTQRIPQYVDVKPERPAAGLETFDTIYEREFDYVWRSLGRLGVAPADIPDAVHEVFLVLYRRWNEVDVERPMRPWLFGVSRRVASAARAKSRELSPEVTQPNEVDESDLARRDLLWRALATLDDDRRTVLILHDLEGHSGLEIAALLDIPANTVHSRLRVARADLAAAVRKLRGQP